MRLVLITIIGVFSSFFIGCKKEATINDQKAVYINYTKDNVNFSYLGDDFNSNGVYDSVYFRPNYSNPWFLIDTLQDSIFLFFRSSVATITNDGRYEIEVVLRVKAANQNLMNINDLIAYKDVQQFESLFNTGEQTLSIGGPNVGFSFIYNDILNNISWSSEGDYGFGVVPFHSGFYNSYLNFTDVERFYSQSNSKEGVRVFADFGMTLYNTTGDSIRLDNGKFALLFYDR